MQVYDRNGNLIEVADGPVPDGCSVGVSVLFMDSQPRDEGARLNDAARQAYDARSERMSNAWRRKKPRHAGPYGNGDNHMDSRRLPAVPSGRPPAKANTLDAEVAYRRLVRDLSTRWKTHRRGALP